MRFFVQQDAMQPMLRGYGAWRRVPNMHAYSTCPIPFNVVMRCLYIAWGWIREPFPYYQTKWTYWEQRARNAEGCAKILRDRADDAEDRLRDLKRQPMTFDERVRAAEVRVEDFLERHSV